MGVVSVPRRNLADALPPKYGLPLRVPAVPPAIFSREGEGRGYLVEKTRGSALAADIRTADLLTTVAERPVQPLPDGARIRGHVGKTGQECDTQVVIIPKRADAHGVRT